MGGVQVHPHRGSCNKLRVVLFQSSLYRKKLFNTTTTYEIVPFLRCTVVKLRNSTPPPRTRQLIIHDTVPILATGPADFFVHSTGSTVGTQLAYL
jgi:hypothetical protein